VAFTEASSFIRIDRLKQEVAGSALAFVVILLTLTLLRDQRLEPSTSVQSVVVSVVSLLAAVSVAYDVFRDGGFLRGWILACGPSLAFTVDLFAPVVAELTPFTLAAPPISAAVISGAIAGMGFLAGRRVRAVSDGRSVTDSL